jgi:hypothetical protein
VKAVDRHFSFWKLCWPVVVAVAPQNEPTLVDFTGKACVVPGRDQESAATDRHEVLDASFRHVQLENTGLLGVDHTNRSAGMTPTAVSYVVFTTD